MFKSKIQSSKSKTGIKFLIFCRLAVFPIGALQGEAPEIRQQFVEAIEDNSLLVEEAYNEDAGYVQHIFNFVFSPLSPLEFSPSFTQEWAVLSVRHQLGYTLPFVFLEEGGKGIGDVLLNYRYQLFKEEAAAAVAPRLSLIFPTGSVSDQTGFGTVGVQINFPVSKRWNNYFVTHFNVGGTFLPGAKHDLPAGGQASKTLTFANLGVSLGWLAHPRFNFLLEYITNFSSQINDRGEVERFNQFVLNPLVRGAIDVGKLQIVPGLGVPLTWTDGDFSPGLLFYLSFEHPFMKTAGN